MSNADLKNPEIVAKLQQPGTNVVDFINILRANFSYESDLRSFFYLHVTRGKLSKRLVQKIRA